MNELFDDEIFLDKNPHLTFSSVPDQYWALFPAFCYPC